MKTNSTFKLSKQSKIHLAQISNKDHRAIIKKAFIEAEVMQHIQPRLSKSRNQDKEIDNG